MRRGATTRARRLAAEVRAELGLSPYARLDPRAVAELYGIPVYPLDELTAWGLPPAALAHLGGHPRTVFSAALVPVGSGRLIVENSAHAETRRRASISHELAHVLLEHPFGPALLGPEGCRLVDRGLEAEADCLGGELLIPYPAAIAAARAELTDRQVAVRYRVSTAYARMRMNRTGARARAAGEKATRTLRRRTA
jgi:hypothetical protein